ncbi:MAG: hybrid sensor histidine kinase/response regulator [Flavobacteriales bacterium]|nr:hybrid sensor histidine kinase/response regulator [Flavobacteriales bacterium]
MSDHLISILYLDDEEQNLVSFRALFRRDYQVFTAITASEAVEVLNNHEVHVVFSDQKMPDLSGVEFFELIQPDFPDPIRILLTGYADIEAVIDAINKGQVYRYLTKPWDENELRITIENAFDLYNSRKQVSAKQTELEKAYAELEKFVYSASHDLRAPLLSIKGIINLARQENDPNKFREYFNMIDVSINRLDAFVQNIIHYYQNEKHEGNHGSVWFESLLNEIIGSLKYTEGADRVQFRIKVNQDRPFHSDELRLRIILSNLLSNAMKFRDPSKPDAWVQVEVHVDNKRCTLNVSDNGPGITPEDQPRVFDMFFRSQHNQGGTGIGLYIVKEAVEKLNGRISLHSTRGNGTSFVIELPEKE